jgi:23S rRNA G2445 N2-methylase RlmL
MFATCLPGLGQLLRRQLDQRPGITTTDVGFDGRADAVLFDADRGYRDEAFAMRTTEDLFVEVGRTLRAEGDKAQWIAGRLWHPQQVERGLSIWAESGRPLGRSMTFRVIARVLSENSFRRTDLRQQLSRVVSEDRTKWRFSDPAQLEVWVTEFRAGHFVAGLRLTDSSMRQHEGRDIERQGALRPTVAAAMVNLAGEPAGTLLDPCCGSGTILAEAQSVGWKVRGSDIDPDAVAVSLRNVPAAQVIRGDGRHLDLEGASIGACVSNLPFGQQFAVQGGMDEWLHGVLAELARVTRPNGHIVLLAPEIPRSAIRMAGLRAEKRYPINLLGVKSTIWAFRRAADTGRP